jgi:23S rRNA pseudouridine2605 synthase
MAVPAPRLTPIVLLSKNSMRINKYVALCTGMSRRAADTAIDNGRVVVNGQKPINGYSIQETDAVTVDGQVIRPPTKNTIMINKPVGYVCSRDGQGSNTIYDILPADLHNLKPVGRLDKNSSGLLLLTNDGDLANQLTHPRYVKQKIYQIQLDKPLQPDHRQQIQQSGVMLDDGLSKLKLDPLNGASWQVTMTEGRNRQIRRSFETLGYTVTKLHRTQFASYALDDLAKGEYKTI